MLTTFVGIMLLSNLVLAVPIAHQFYGNVSINGSPAPDGTTVVAKIDGTEVGSTTTKGGKYGYDPVFIISLSSIQSGRTINFFVNGNQANENFQSCYDFACSTELDLTATGETTSGTTTTTTGGGAPSGGGSTPSTETTTETTETTEEGCQERWTCSDWGACENGIQTRVCEDINNCGTNSGEPFSSQPCATVGEEAEASVGPSGFFLLTPTNLLIGSVVLIIVAAITIFLLRRKSENIVLPPKALL